MKLDYLDISAFVEHIQEKAIEEGKNITTVDELHRFLDKNPEESITIIDRRN